MQPSLHGNDNERKSTRRGKQRKGEGEACDSNAQQSHNKTAHALTLVTDTVPHGGPPPPPGVEAGSSFWLARSTLTSSWQGGRKVMSPVLPSTASPRSVLSPPPPPLFPLSPLNMKGANLEFTQEANMGNRHVDRRLQLSNTQRHFATRGAGQKSDGCETERAKRVV